MAPSHRRPLRTLLVTDLVVIAAALWLLWAVPLTAQDRRPLRAESTGALPDAVATGARRLLCGTPAIVARQMRSGFASPSRTRMADTDMEPRDGSPLWYDQQPHVIRANDPRGLAFNDFLVVGDVETLLFERWSPSTIVAETWTRTTTTSIDGHLVSVFNPSWNHAELWDSVGAHSRGVDEHGVYFGWLKSPQYPDDGWGLWVRVAPINIPESRVERIDATTQYASHVVNIVIPGFGDGRVTDDYQFELQEVTQRFYVHFPDTYDTIAVAPAQTHLTENFGAYHHSVRNRIAGLGIEVFDNTADYGSDGVLRSIEMYGWVAALSSTYTSNHELGHHWADYWDWPALTAGEDFDGVDYDGSHGPVLYPGSGMIMGGINATWGIAAADDDTGFVIERASAGQFHPTVLYRMGLIGPEAVPDLLVFEDQGQFEDPETGATVEGGARRVHINDVLAEHGTRGGPVESTLRRATVVVSRDELLSLEEMSYWNFVAARHAATEGITGFHGVGSFYEATGGRVRLHTDVTPTTHARIVNFPPLQVSHVPIDPREFPGLELDEPVPGSISAGEQITIAGTVTTTERDDFSHVCVGWWRDATESWPLWECGDILGNRFSVPFMFTEDHVGQYELQIYLEWPDSSDVRPRSITGITVRGSGDVE